MRVVIMASGRSNRLQPIPDKVALKFLGRTLLEYQVQQLLNHGLTELFIIYGTHNQETIESICQKLPIAPTLIQQSPDQFGMSGAIIALAQNYPDQKPFLLMGNNDIISDAGLQAIQEAMTATPDQAFLLAKTVKEYFPGGYLEITNDQISRIIEKPAPGNEPSNMINLVYHYHTNPTALFQAVKDGKNDDHYEQGLQELFDQGANYKALTYNGPWQTIKYPWQIHDMALSIFQKISPQIDSSVEIAPTAIIEGPVSIGPNTKVLHNAVIKGPTAIGANCVIANNCLVRESFIGDNCTIGFGSEVARSYLQDDVWLHNNYIGDSIIGNNVAFGAGSCTGNFRLDEQTISVNIKGEPVDSGQTKLGLITGDNIRCGIQTCFMPGTKVGSNSMIGANLTIAEDIPDHSFVKGETKLIIKPNTKQILKRS